MHMLTITLPLLALLVTPSAVPTAPDPDVARWERHAAQVTIVRDDWGIPHIYARSDADVVFGLMYAQAEDDFNRVETNFINSMGRLSEAEGQAEIYRDLRMKLFVNPDSMKAKYRTSPAWLRTLMDSWADGLNFYLHKHPRVKPRVITRFEPWMALTFSEGSIGGDIERVSTRDLEAFYGGRAVGRTERVQSSAFTEPGGSNGFAIAPSNTQHHKALLWINPHTSFFFRAEAQMVSQQGLNAYGAITWGQFFVYQGFNDRAGWMHTSSNADNSDEYLETVTKKGDGYVYRYGGKDRPLTATKVVVPYRTGSGMASKEFTVYRTHHGPIVRAQDGRWVSFRIMQEPVKALIQSYTRTRARNYREFRKSMDLHTNSSNNTIFADADGDIAYFHANFVPKRDPRFDWTKPVDGSDPATEWKGVHSVEESPHLRNPASGWLYNTNNWPFSAAGANSPKQADYPPYMESGTENERGIHAMRVLSGKKDFTPASLMAAAFDSYMPAFDIMLPPLLSAFDQLTAGDPLRARLAEQVGLLRAWDRRWSITSVPTSLAVYWGEELQRTVSGRGVGNVNGDEDLMKRSTPDQRLRALAAASDRLASEFGQWKTPWGDINRFQRLTGDIVQPFNDAAPSIPVGFTAARWGSLASFGARPYPNTKKWYGTSGNSFVAVVEFGDSVRAKAVSAGGESGDPKSPHFSDQAVRYTTGELRDVYFYRSQLRNHTDREYHPGQ
ncbi:MAG: penicillin acylase family protein [Polaromonas sp.]|nr:penicillin acylase family protein [Gemmatimonadaceae bacterium]